MPKTSGPFLAALLAVATLGVNAQNISTYNALLYDSAGVTDAELLREMHVTLRMQLHKLVDAFFNDLTSDSATVELDEWCWTVLGRGMKHFACQRRRKRQGPVQPRFQLLDFRARFARLQQGQIGQRWLILTY